MTVVNNLEVTIDTVAPVLSLGQIQLSADKRGTKEKPIADAERIRRAVLPANHWGSMVASLEGTANQSLTDVLRAALIAIGSERLKDFLAEQPLARTIKLSDYTVASLLAWNADNSAGRGSITFTREQVENWFAVSATRAALLTKHAGKSNVAAFVAVASSRFATLAAKNHGLKDEQDALKLISIIDAADLAGSSASLTTEIIGRLEYIAKALAAKAAQLAAEQTVSVDDL